MKLNFTLLALLFSISVSAQDSLLSKTEMLKLADKNINDYQFEKALSLLHQSPDSLSAELLQRKGYC